MKMTNTLKRALIRDLTKATGCSCHFINDDLGIYYDSVLQFIYIDYTKQKNYTELLENMIAAVELIGCIYSGTQDTLAESSYEEVVSYLKLMDSSIITDGTGFMEFMYNGKTVYPIFPVPFPGDMCGCFLGISVPIPLVTSILKKYSAEDILSRMSANV